MEINERWSLLRSSSSAQIEGLRHVRAAYLEDPNESRTIELGVALLWLGQYNEAWEHFRARIELRPKSTADAYFGMAGTAKWCLGKPGDAVAEWRAGLKAKYARGSGLNVKMPLLLYFASLIEPEAENKNEIVAIMRKKCQDKRADVGSWPTPIMKFVLGKISETQLIFQCNEATEEATSNSIWQARFYQNLITTVPSCFAVFRDHMRQMCDWAGHEWQDDDLFLARIWKEEFYLARYESNRTNDVS